MARLGRPPRRRIAAPRAITACCMLAASSRAAWSLLGCSSCTEAVSEPLFALGLRERRPLAGIYRASDSSRRGGGGAGVLELHAEGKKSQGAKEASADGSSREAGSKHEAAEEEQEAAGDEVADVAEDEAATKKAAADTKKRPKKKEKWVCPACGSKNFPGKRECYRCGAAHPSGPEVKLMKQKDTAAAGLSEKMDSIIRLQADLENYRSSHETELNRVQSLGRQDALRALLPILTVINDERGADTAEMTEKEQQLHNSFGMLFAKVGDMFDKFGAKKFEPEIGEAYDATRHKPQEFREPGPGEKPGAVVEVLKPGWQCDDNVLVPSVVVMSKKAEAEQDAAPTPADGDEEEHEEAKKEEDASATDAK